MIAEKEKTKIAILSCSPSMNDIVAQWSDDKNDIVMETITKSLPELRTQKEEGSGGFILILSENADSSISILQDVHNDFPAAHLLLLSRCCHPHQVRELCAAGCSGILTPRDITSLHEILKTILSGRRYISSAISNIFFQNLLTPGSGTYTGHAGSPRCQEHQVFQLMGAGMNAEEVARILGIDMETVNRHKARLNGLDAFRL